MSPRSTTIVAAAVIAAALSGCRVDPYQEVREREWRRLEDEIYCRDDMIAELEAQLDSCRRENDALKRRGGGSSSSSADEPLPLPNVTVPDDDVPPEELKDFAPPKTDLGTEAPPPLGQRTPSRRRRPIVLTSNTNTAISEAAGHAPPATGDTVCGPAVSLKFNRRITGGNNTDGRFGDEGILAVVEARDAAGELVSDPGAMTLTVYDPGQSGGGGVVARWDFAAAEVAARFRSGPFGTGVNFELPWPNQPPRRSQLRLEARCDAANGKTLVANHKFAIDVPTVSAKSATAKSAPAKSEATTSTPVVEQTSAALPPWQPTRN
jgi:hypothetical protein